MHVGLIFARTIPKKIAFRSKQCVFLGYNNLHKGFKCLDVAAGRVYISHDVIFDETVFPFASLNTNAGTPLHSEVLLHPETSLSELIDHEGELVVDQQDSFSTNYVANPREIQLLFIILCN